MMKSVRIKVYFIAIMFLAASGLLYLADAKYGADTLPGEYLLFSRRNLDIVLQDAVPSAEELLENGDVLSFSAAKDEIEPVTFSVRSSKDLGSVSVTVSDLVSGSKVINKNQIEVLNQKIWRQCSERASAFEVCNKPDHERFEAIEVPELLLRDNEQDLAALEVGWDGSRYTPPSVNQDFNVRVTANSTHTFYLRAKIPKDATAGTYTGVITFIPENGAPTDIPLSLEVLPYVLPDAEKEMFVFFDSEPNGTGERAFTRELFRQYLEMFLESGVQGFVFDPPNDQEAEWISQQLQELGFKGTVVIDDRYISNQQKLDIKSVKSYFESRGMEVYFFGENEPWFPDRMILALEQSKNIHENGGKVVTGIRKECAEAMIDPELDSMGTWKPSVTFEGYDDLRVTGRKIQPIERIDFPWYSGVDTSGQWCLASGNEDLPKGTFADYVNGLFDGTIVKNEFPEGYYKNLFPETPSKARTMYGNFLWASGLDSVAGEGIEGFYASLHGSKQFDDFDGVRKNANSIYRSQEGPILTLQWEGAREGIDDVRYLTKFNTLLDYLPASEAESMRRELKEQLKPYRFGTLGPWTAVEESTNENLRLWLKNKIGEMIGKYGDHAIGCDNGRCEKGERCGSDCISAGPLIADWTFDEDKGFVAYDSEQQNHGMMKDFSAGSRVKSGCISGECLSFDGADDYILVPEDPILDGESALTISGWFKPDRLHPGGAMVLKEGAYGLHFWEDSIYFDVWNTNGQRHIDPHYTLEAGDSWVHVAAVFENGTKRLFINGDQVGESKMVQTKLLNSDLPLLIGKHWAASYYSGLMDELKVYNKSLSSEEIRKIFESSSVTTCDDGVRNGDEEGVDCGGSCKECETSQTSPAQSLPSCSDNIQNQGEEGVDCGGPCISCPETEVSVSYKPKSFERKTFTIAKEGTAQEAPSSSESETGTMTSPLYPQSSNSWPTGDGDLYSSNTQAEVEEESQKRNSNVIWTFVSLGLVVSSIATYMWYRKSKLAR